MSGFPNAIYRVWGPSTTAVPAVTRKLALFFWGLWLARFVIISFLKVTCTSFHSRRIWVWFARLVLQPATDY